MNHPVPLQKLQITDSFFSSRIRQMRDISIPYMWDALNDRIPEVPPSGCIANLRVAAGETQGAFIGCVFQDSDLWKWIEGVAYALAAKRDDGLEAQADGVIALAGKAQQPDGYLDTYYIINGLDKRFTNLRDHHELYVAGHMFEAACAYEEATGKRTLLEIACRFADCIDRHFGPGPEQCHGYPGHEEIELGLARLYRATGHERYLRLGLYFLDQRGRQPYYFDQEALARGEKLPNQRRNQWQTYAYFQAEMPVRQQEKATGHAVRQGYLLSGMADIGALAGDQELVDAARRVFDNIVTRQMYITGGVGATHVGEAFSLDYDLPPERCYNETCASIALIMTAARMNRIAPEGRYGDVIERALYNGILSGISLDGTKYFYMNPLEVWPERCEKRQDMAVDDQRQGWFGCACCPPNLLRTLTGLGQYVYTLADDALYVDQYIASQLDAALQGGTVHLAMASGMPWTGKVTLRLEMAAPQAFTLALRIPAWTHNAAIALNGQAIHSEIQNGYARISRTFADGDTITLDFPMVPRFLRASGHVPNYAGKVALVRGPLVYCLEEADNGRELWNLSLASGEICENWEESLLGGVVTLACPGNRETAQTDALYAEQMPEAQPVSLRFVPYYAWGNRGKGEMTVWLPSR